MSTPGPISLDAWRRGDGAWQPEPGRGWLMLGKGPSFRAFRPEETEGRHTMGLNHIVREVPVDVAHLIDLDVVTACEGPLKTGCRMVCMPRVPNVGSRPGRRTLEELVGEIPVLGELAAEERLVWFNTATTPAVAGSPKLPVGAFSSVTALALLAELGARDVASLGVDGGRGYAGAFADMAESTRLQNGQQLFDAQFTQLQDVAQARGINFAPMVPPVRVGLMGGAGWPTVVEGVLEYSVRCHASGRVAWAGRGGDAQIGIPAEVALVGADVLSPGWREQLWRPSDLLPWQAPQDPASRPWLQAFAEAVHAGLVDRAMVVAGIRSGDLAPQLLRLPLQGEGLPPPWSVAGERIRLQRELANMKLSPAWISGRRLVAGLQRLGLGPRADR